MLDCITDAESIQLCYNAIGRAGGRYTCLEFCPESLQTRKAVKPDFVLGYEMFGKRVVLGPQYSREANPKAHKAAVTWLADMQKLVDEGKIKSHPIRVIPGGFQGIINGLEILRKGAISGQKMVIFVAYNPGS